MTLSCWPCFSLPWPFVAPACVQQHPACWTSCCLGSGAHQHSMLTAQPPLSLCHIPSCMRPQLHSVLRKAHLKPSPYCLNFNYSCQLPCCQGCLCSSVLSFLQVMGRHQHKVFARHALHQQHSVEGGPPSSRSVGGQLPCMPCTSTIIPAQNVRHSDCGKPVWGEPAASLPVPPADLLRPSVTRCFCCCLLPEPALCL